MYSAAELAIQAMIRSGAQMVEPNKGHQTRGTWLEAEVQHGNVPQAFHDAYQHLRLERRNARYGEATVSITAIDLDSLIEVVRSMITHGRMRAGLGSLDTDRNLTSTL